MVPAPPALHARSRGIILETSLFSPHISRLRTFTPEISLESVYFSSLLLPVSSKVPSSHPGPPVFSTQKPEQCFQMQICSCPSLCKLMSSSPLRLKTKILFCQPTSPALPSLLPPHSPYAFPYWHFCSESRTVLPSSRVLHMFPLPRMSSPTKTDIYMYICICVCV